ncbi:MULTISPECIES: bifunctional [glutamine synthetase] adenylyltransferase/[glutamine synthetase]-adenylyl-L-tyrosine phosphorylase [Brevundimonas]|uniref:bifunctional [glutamine synthetase] adenylyltransferase/[glutamine synthetase]-adenylyl-L-tyrosine phosphorylase n=1 Tax=Brevundimonas TaxID=41275 RepID=UPI0019058C6E|nr:MULTISPECIES: bifunctional [glutamine synthetase] adenylyltransferase/[glutamine synthetase]-adenylyl-L-tyrosine phosphorylase [Brevundimonas]MBK1969144.1 bifunctional [glutamine synthetase] adenylyltransferase/[glutamine synthetase]-adenylyl-L-tyrosine phosphorylase [Brevundimonas diminuta]MBK1974449.1 bifunctional [glutamine synthetase] adenylyltransferase/[glutamine synthetase]-adenylyl-L-tyrosine phosphorylase [Brevundimonas diminuta]MDM8353233.1 bifunctional [glutamine synthetase] adenyl
MNQVLATRLQPCGPVRDAEAAARLHERLAEAADADGWRATLDAAWAALEPVFAASPYLAGLARRWPDRLRLTLESDPEARLAEILAATDALTGAPDEAKAPLRHLKAELHLLTALCDLGGVWNLDQVTSALSRFADAAARAALRITADDWRRRGRLVSAPDDPRGPVPGLFVLAMGKGGAFELNYSSDIDLSLFYEPEALETALSEGVEMQGFVNRLAQGLTALLAERTADGYVFRVDLRLRPDPSSTPPVVAAPMALAYYESVGQNWERAAFIKARVCAGDAAEGADFLKALVPYIWRRSLDYQAVLDIQSIKKQIHVHKTGEGLEAAGANLKLGRGGIREIEFYVQTQQLILGGRDRSLRSPRTLEALDALSAAGHVAPEARDDLCAAYVELRALEHRAQMLADEQTHILPVDPERRADVAALAGQGDLAAFDAEIERLLVRVNARYGELFEGGEDLSSPYGSLVFTGVENDPGTLETLARMGFSEPATVSDTIRSWHHGRIQATRTARGRELFTRLAPQLLTAVAKTGAPDAAFRRFAVFFSGLSAGVQVQALFLNQPKLFDLVVGVMAFAPRLARALGRQPQALDGVLDARFMTALGTDTGLADQVVREAHEAGDFEGAMNAVRRLHREQTFRIGMHVVTGRTTAEQAGLTYTSLADACMKGLAPAALAEAERMGGAFDGAVAVVALGKAGSREMTAGSDLDLMTVYAAPPEAVSAGRGWSAETFYGRFTQRFIAALSAHTAEGGLYEVDMRLRPTGSKGPVSVRLETLQAYYAEEADTWEFMALTRARVVWASDATFGPRVTAVLEEALRRPRPGVDAAHDVRAMRDLMERERRAKGFWDLKLSAGAQVDAEFVGQYRQLTAAAAGRPLTVSTLEALKDDPILADSWRTHQQLSQLTACAFEDRNDPDQEPSGFQKRLAATIGAPDFDTLKARLIDLRMRARRAFDAVLPPIRDGN